MTWVSDQLPKGPTLTCAPSAQEESQPGPQGRTEGRTGSSLHRGEAGMSLCVVGEEREGLPEAPLPEPRAWGSVAGELGLGPSQAQAFSRVSGFAGHRLSVAHSPSPPLTSS